MNQTNQRKKIIFFALILVVLSLIIFFISLFFRSPERQAKEVVNEFYTYEQEGVFSKSWELFHPYMQEKLPREDYIQDRPQVFMNHFEVSSFSYSLGDIKKVKNWTMEDGKESIDTVYRITVYQRFAGKYGKFTITQYVYATNYADHWRILWDYSG